MFGVRECIAAYFFFLKRRQRLDKGFWARVKGRACTKYLCILLNGHDMNTITMPRVQVEVLDHMRIVEGAINFLSNNTYMNNSGTVSLYIHWSKEAGSNKTCTVRDVPAMFILEPSTSKGLITAYDSREP